MIRLGVIAALLFALSGCCGWRGSRAECCPQQAVLRTPPPVNVATSPAPNGAIEVGPLPAPAQFESREPPSQPQAWWTVTERDCQCLAAKHAALANLMDRERGFLQAAEGDDSCAFQTMTRLRTELLVRQAVQERNNAAERALLAYYGLVETLLQQRVLDRTRQEIDDLNAAVRLIQEVEVAIDLDATEGLRRLADALSKGSELETLHSQIQTQLRSMLGVAEDQPARIWPSVRLEPSRRLDELSIAQQRAVDCRADLDSVRLVRRSLNAQTLAAARTILASVQAGLGADLKSSLTCTPSCLTQWAKRDDCDDQKELAARCAQLAELQAFLESTVRQQVAKQDLAYVNAVRRAVLAQQKIDAWQTRRRQLEASTEAGSPSGPLLVQAKLMKLAAESELVHELIAAEMARVRWKAAQGLLATECQCGSGCLPQRWFGEQVATATEAESTRRVAAQPKQHAEADVRPSSSGPDLEFPPLPLPQPPEFAEFLRR